jgi:hypothetical protein
VRRWAIEAEGIENAVEYIDGFGNRVHLVTHCKRTASSPSRERRGRYRELLWVSSANSEKQANPLIFLKATPLTRSSPEIDALADEAQDAKPIGRLHYLLENIAARVTYDT